MLDDGCGTRLDMGMSGFAEDCGNASCSCDDLEGPDGSLFMGTSVRQRVGDAGDELAWAHDDKTLASEGNIVGLVVVWDRDNGDGVYCHTW